MDTSEADNKSVIAPSGISGSVEVALHPLVIMNISDHWTRVRAQNGKEEQVIGALIGTQNGRRFEIMNSYEFIFHVVEGLIVIDKDFYTRTDAQFKQVFPDYDFLGWYTTGSEPNSADIHVHKQICTIIESPLFLKLNPHGVSTELPVSVFESVLDLVAGQTTVLFVSLGYSLATEEAERISVDHVARVSTAGDSSGHSQVVRHLQSMHSSIKMLHQRVLLIVEYLRAVETGLLEKNHEILREISSLSHRLPVVTDGAFQNDFYTQFNDTTLLAYLGEITKTCATINEFANKFNTLYDRHGATMGKGRRSLFY